MDKIGNHIVMGLDPSLVSSGYAYQKAGGGFVTGRLLSKKLRGPERLSWINKAVDATMYEASVAVGGDGVDLVVYEDYAMGAKGKTFHIGELGGVLKMACWRKGIDMLLVPPSNLKLFATGKRGGKKEEVIATLNRQYGLSLRHDDEADALALYLMGVAWLRRDRLRSKMKAESLAKCTFVSGLR